MIIDYFLVRADLREDVNDVRVVFGAEIGSDHHLVLTKMKVRGRKQTEKTEKKGQLRIERLRTEEGKMKYCAKLSQNEGSKVCKWG